MKTYAKKLKMSYTKKYAKIEYTCKNFKKMYEGILKTQQKIQENAQ